jgi:serine/threonine protein kinase
MSTPPTSPGTPNDRLAAFFDTSQPCDAFDDVQIEEIAFLLARSGHCAQNAPRTYIVLRSIGRLDVLEQLLSVGFGDGWFPVEARSLPGFLEPRVRNEIVQSQRVILTKASNLEKGRHCHFGSGDSLPFTTLARLGSGAFGTVTRIESTITFRQYALKTIRRRAAFGEKSKQAMGEILSEMRIMQSLQHNHIVRYVGSFTNKNSFGILMLPVADQDLAAYLQDAATDPRRYPTVRTFFGCLATALSFLHDNLVKHRDIKPQNILMYQSKVLLTDFGLSRDYMDTSSGLTPASPRYCAPEVAAHESRNTSADVWSLGCVFLEILATLRGLDVEWLKEYYDGIGDGSTHYHANTTATESLLREWTATSHRDTYPLACTKDMLKPRRNSRPSAAEVAQKIMACDDQVGLMYSCSSCYDPDSDSDSMSSVVEKLEIAHRFPPVLRKPVPSPSMAQLTPAATQDSGSEPALQLISGSSTASIITTDTLGDSTQEEATAAGPQPQAEESALSTPNTRSNDTSTTVSLGEPLADRPAPEDSSPTSPNPASIAPAPALASESSPSKIQSTPHAVITNHETDHVDSLRKEMQLAWEVKHKGSTSSENPFSILKTETEGNLQHRQVSAPSSQHLWAIPGVLDSYYGPESSSYIFRRVSGKTVHNTHAALAIEIPQNDSRMFAPEYVELQPPLLKVAQSMAEDGRGVLAERVQQRSPQNQHQFVEGMQTKDGDDDIPLAILHKQQRGTLESIAQQELEDTESLGRRRGRLFGALNTRKKEADPGSTSMGAELEAPDEDTNMPQSKAIISRTQSAESELQTVLRLSPTGPLLSRAGDTSLPFVLPAELLTTHQSQPLPTKGEHIKVAKSRAKRTRVFGVDPCESVEYAGYDIGQIPFFIDSEVILIPGRVPFIFGKCIEVILQSQSTYTDKHTWRRGMVVDRSVHACFLNILADTAQISPSLIVLTSISTESLQTQFRSYWQPLTAHRTMVMALTGTIAKPRTLHGSSKDTFYRYPRR